MQRLGLVAVTRNHVSRGRRIYRLTEISCQRQLQCWSTFAPRPTGENDWISYPQRPLPTPLVSRQSPPWQMERFRLFSAAAQVETATSEDEACQPEETTTATKRRYKRRIRKTLQTAAVKKKALTEQELRQELEQLFEEIAPFVMLENLDQYVVLLRRNQAPKQRQKLADKSSQESPENDTTMAPKHWSQSKILAFLELLPLHARPVQTLQTPADMNLRSIQSATTTLLKAREKSVLSQELAWSQLRKGPAATLRQEWFEATTPETRRQEAHEMARELASRLPTKRFQSLMQLMDEYVKAPTKHMDGNHTDDDASPKQRVGIRRLFNNVEKKLGDHVHLVAPELARFFYFDPPLRIQEEEEQEQESAGEEEETKKKKTRSIVNKEPKFVSAKKKWNESKERFVKNLVAIQKKIQKQTAEEKGHPDDDAEEVDLSADLEEEEEEALAEIVTANLRKSSSSTSKVDQIDESGSKKNKTATSAAQQQRVHLIYDAVLVEEHLDEDKEYPASADTTVFVDNLPIDITETELIALYERCGDLESVEIFNQRPDLDPGPFSNKTMRDQARQNRGRRSAPQPRNSGHVSRWARPRTPVYGMLTFANEEAAQCAAQDALRIFGMIVRGHSVRSLKAKDMTRLYVDNIERALKLSAMDIEHQLSQLLNPSLYLSLDITSGTDRGGKRARPGSFEVMFPTFEVAFEAFVKLREDLDLVKSKECRINWLRTPLDANKYWTRQLGGVV